MASGALNPQTQLRNIDGPAGVLACALDAPTQGPIRGVVVICHPHPQGGGTMDNKVVHTIARACLALGWRTVRFNFRGVGGSQGTFDDGHGEIDDARAVIKELRQDGESLGLAGFSFGGFVAASVAEQLTADEAPSRLILVAPSTQKQRVPDVPADTVVVHGDADDVVPLAATLDWARPQSLPVVVLPGVGHFFHGHLPLLRRVLMQQLVPMAAIAH